MDPQTSQRPFPTSGLMPPQPEAFPDVSPDPLLQPEDRLTILGQLVVRPPALDIPLPGVPQLVAGSALAASPHLPHFCFESLDTLQRCSDLQFAVQPKAQELAFPNPPCPALGGVHLQPQILLDPPLNRRQRPFRRRLTAYVDVAVIRIPAERVPALLQFLIERI